MGVAAVIYRAKRHRPKRLIANWGYDSNAVRALLIKRAIEPIIPVRRSNTIATLGSKPLSVGSAL
jgi:hypothetical protein